MNVLDEYLLIMSAYDDNGEYEGSYPVRIIAMDSEVKNKAEKYIAEYNAETDEGIQMRICSLTKIGNIQVID